MSWTNYINFSPNSHLAATKCPVIKSEVQMYITLCVSIKNACYLFSEKVRESKSLNENVFMILDKMESLQNIVS